MRNNLFARLCILFVCLIVTFGKSNAQIITTFAGIDTSGFSGNGGPATAARIRNPYSIVLDHKGNLYFTEYGNNCIRKVNKAGIISTFAGRPDTAGDYQGDGGPATAAKFNGPASMGIDDIGNIYVADMKNDVIRRIDTTDTVATIVGTTIQGFGGDGGPARLATINYPVITVDGPGNIYIADVKNHRIRMVNTAGTINTIAGTGAAGYSLNDSIAISSPMSPQSVSVDPEGNIYFVDAVSTVYRVVRKIGGGKMHTFLNFWAESFAFDTANNIYFSDLSCYVRRITPDSFLHIYAGNGDCATYGDTLIATEAAMHTPMGMAFDDSMNLYVAEYDGQCIRKISYAPVTGIHNIPAVNGAIKVFPNPATSSFTVELPAVKDNAAIVVSDLTGRIVMTKTVQGSVSGIHEDFNSGHLAPGAYLVIITSGSATYREKVLIR